MNEEWRPVVGYEGFYEVSNTGSVRTVARMVRAAKGMRSVRQIIRRLSDDRDGYKTVSLDGMRKPRLLKVHRLVAESFIGPIGAGMCINHKDGVRSNNHLGNLEICTADYNRMHQVTVLRSNIGEKSARAKLSNADVMEIIQLAERLTYRQISVMFRVSYSAIAAIMCGKSWSAVSGKKRMRPFKAEITAPPPPPASP